ncbi:hypothetical protein HVA01_10100 [Halovibrio variabilis]|uniref:Uncharacterized protein n=1 Tax=Halovibrio variabilis TaxID=31910 RepID=A0A511UL75_9GAMM|nr:hypothetical protein HVA01_10100 [Halovibrio variabilis]
MAVKAAPRVSMNTWKRSITAWGLWGLSLVAKFGKNSIALKRPPTTLAQQLELALWEAGSAER